MISREAVAVAVVAAPVLAAALLAIVPLRFVARVAVGCALPTGGLALGFAIAALAGDPSLRHGIAIDAAGGLLVGVTALVGFASVVVSPDYRSWLRGSIVAPARRIRFYFVLLYSFWAVLLAIPIAGNLGTAWLLVEASTAPSALLVGFSGKGRALEAGWKYLVLTSLGLAVALLGIVILTTGLPGGLGGLSWRELPHYASGPKPALVAYVLLLAGLAAKIGWAPVHNWLPDAHSEAPAPVSALLSAALLPSVLLVAWRSEQALAPVIGAGTVRSVLIGFGLASLAVAIPFLWRSLAWKRLLAYSSLEHMGVLALGIGFASPLALAGVAIHIAGHAVAKALGFYAATPLIGHEPRALAHGVTGIARTERKLGAILGISLGTLAGLPPSPLFASELLIVAGGFQAGRYWAAAVATLLLGLGFVGLYAFAARGDCRQGAQARRRADPRPARCGGAGRGLGSLARGAQRSRVVAPWNVSRRRPRKRAHVMEDGSYRLRIEEALADGWRFGGLHASLGGTLVRTLLVGPDGSTRLETVEADAGQTPSIVDLAPAADWDEREAHDLSGVRFSGHEPLRPLVEHDPELRRWTVPVHGRGPYQVAVGPIHAGVIESGHFRFHVVGDRILHLDPRLFYKHRGLERAAEGKTLAEGLAFAGRACAACSVANTLSYAHACEEALGLAATPELARARTILLELERTWNHLNDIAAMCAGAGLAAGNSLFAALTEQARRLNATLAGHRFLFGAIRVGGSDLELGQAEISAAREQLDSIRAQAASGSRALLFNSSFQDRLPGIGVVSSEAAHRLGTVGPAARASGIAADARTASTRLAYEGFEPVASARPEGDVRARFEQRSLELEQSIAILEGLLDGPVNTASAAAGDEQREIGVGRVESPRGATTCIVERSGDRVSRLRLRTGSYANWPSVAHAAADNLLPDFPLINKSFELCYACVDR